MPKVQENQEFERELIPAWSHFVRLVQIIDLWTQTQVWNEETKELRKVMFTFELPDETYEYETKEWEKKTGVKLKSNQFTLSRADSATLRKTIEVWLWQQTLGEWWLDVSVWLGKCGIGTIQHNVAKNGKTYDNLEAITPLMKGMEEKKQITPSLYFDLDNYDAKLFDTLPEWIQTIIRKSPEYVKVAGNEVEDENSLPF